MQFWIHPDGYLYSGDNVEGAREATLEEIGAHLNPVPSPEQREKELSTSIQTFVDQTAQERGYNDMLYLTSYSIATNNDKWAAEAIAGANWRNDIWDIFNTTMDKIHSGEIPFPDTEEFINSLPRIIWPESTPNIPTWIKPEGAHDVYPAGAKVLFEGKIYISDIDHNSWSPADCCWTEQF